MSAGAPESRPPDATPLPFHPLAVAVFPALSLYSTTLGQYRYSALLVPLGALIALAVAVWGTTHLFVRERHRSALLATWFLVLFMGAGHLPAIYGMKRVVLGDGSIVLPAEYVLSAAGLVLFLAAFRTRLSRPESLTRWLNLGAGCLVLVPLLVIGGAAVKRVGTVRSGGRARVSLPRASRSPARPHVFYLVLDGYGREDVLRELYGHDNAGFLDALRERGFTVASEATSNYAQTALSMVSSLDMRYLDEEDGTPGSPERRRLIDAINDPEVAAALRTIDYQPVGLASYYLEKHRWRGRFIDLGGEIDEFRAGLLARTPLAPLASRLQLNAFDTHRTQFEQFFDRLPRLAAERRPLFVLAHLLSPHPPFLHEADGTPREHSRAWFAADGDHYLDYWEATAQEYREGYVGQLRYVNTRLLAMLDRLLDVAPDAVVIILGDHGPGSGLVHDDPLTSDARERLAILAALRLPKQCGAGVPDDLTPVNVFRLVLSSCFGADLPLLENRRWLSPWSDPFDLHEVVAREEGWVVQAP